MTATAATVQGLLSAFARGAGWNRAGARSFPTRHEMHRVLDRLLDLLFPGFFGERPVPADALRAHLEEGLALVQSDLQALLAQALRAEAIDGEDVPAPDGRARAAAARLVGDLPAIREALNEDLLAAYRGDPAARSVQEVVLSYPFVEVVSTYRLAHVLYLEGIPYVPRTWTERAHSRTGADIHPGATIGHGFFIDHCTGVVIGETSVIGDNVKLFQGVTLGGLSYPKDADGFPIKGLKRHPTVGNNVTIYAGATVLGGQTTIGDDSVIGGNVWLTHSVPPRSKVQQSQEKARIQCPVGEIPPAGPEGALGI